VSSELSSRGNKERSVLVLTPLLLLQLALLSLQIEGPSGTLLFKTWTLAATAPFIAAASSVTRGIRHVWQGYIWMVGARSENERLQQTVRQLSLVNRAYEQAQQENIRLRRLVSMNESAGFRSIGARVVARAPSFLSNVIYINRGSQDGVRIDAPVLSGDGIIGRTVLVSGHQSQVQLITNEDASVGVMLQRSRTPGVVRGNGDSLLDLKYISTIDPVTVGDVVLSSGLDGIFPKGLVIGKVVRVGKSQDVFWSIKVQPGMDLIHLEEVLVLLDEFKPEPEMGPMPPR